MQAFRLSIGLEVLLQRPLRLIGKGARRAFGDARRLFTGVNTLNTKTAFSYHLLAGAEFGDLERTGLEAVFAAYAFLNPMFDYAIRSSPQGANRAGGHAGGIITMKTGGGDPSLGIPGRLPRWPGMDPS